MWHTQSGTQISRRVINKMLFTLFLWMYSTSCDNIAMSDFFLNFDISGRRLISEYKIMEAYISIACIIHVHACRYLTYPNMMSSPYLMELLFCLVGLPWLRSGELWHPLDGGGLCVTGPLSTITQSIKLLYTSTKKKIGHSSIKRDNICTVRKKSPMKNLTFVGYQVTYYI